MSSSASAFPAQAIAAPLCEAVRQHNAIVAAPPGAGKSTVLPLALLACFPDKKILLMQPRRVVVRSLAGYLAAQLGEEVGQQVGYRIRGEQQVSASTRLEIITEGILSRRIQQDPELTGVDMIVFDEFHERSIHTDFGLALALEVQQGLREDLRLVVMSATLDTHAVAGLLPDARLLVSEGKMYPVAEVYCGQVAGHQLHQRICQVALQACSDSQQDVLVFLPGAGGINKVAQLLGERTRSDQVVHRLYGALDKAQQDAALQPDAQGRQKIILATNIAETSLTIANIGAVVDSGLENIAQFHPGTGLTQLSTQMISQASAAQRKGRAGRLGPGTVYRLWPKEQHERLARHSSAQILLEDITSLMLETLAWGTRIEDLALLDMPSAAQCQAARAVLQQLGATDPQHQLTAYGRRLALLPCHPRLGHMLLQAHQSLEAGASPLLQAAVWVAALAQDSVKPKAEATVRETLLNLEHHQYQRLQRQASRYLHQLAPGLTLATPKSLSSREIGLAVALAYTDLIAHNTDTSQYKLACGKGAIVPSAMSGEPWLAVLNGQQRDGNMKVSLAEPIAAAEVESRFADLFHRTEKVSYNRVQQRMEARQVNGFAAIELSSKPLPAPAARHLAQAWRTYLHSLPVADWPLEPRALQWLHRLALAHRLHLPQSQAFDEPQPWPDSDNPLTLIEPTALDRALSRCRTWRQLGELGWTQLLQQSLPWPMQQALDALLPVRHTVPSGQQHTLDYQSDGQVVLAVRMQEMYGQTEVIRIAQGRQNVVVSLLSPAGRPLQMTADLGQFWQGSYQEIKKEMKGRYPKHFWPDDPASATPTTKTKRAMQQ